MVPLPEVICQDEVIVSIPELDKKTNFIYFEETNRTLIFRAMNVSDIGEHTLSITLTSSVGLSTVYKVNVKVVQ